MQDLSLGRLAVCIVGAKGEGKTAFVREMLAPALGCPASGVYTLPCYKDMTARDLLQRRSTDAFGNTKWDPSPLLRAAWTGGLLVLDGLHRLKPEVLSSLAATSRPRRTASRG